MKKNQSRRLETIKKGAEKGTEWKHRWGKGCHSVLYEEQKRLGCMGVCGGGAEARRRSKAAQCHWWPREDALMKGARLFPWNRERQSGRCAGCGSGLRRVGPQSHLADSPKVKPL